MRLSLCSISTLALSSSAFGQVVQWDIVKSDALLPRLRPRDGSSFDSALNNNIQLGGYIATVQVGTPGQQLSLQLDTGSSDVWVPSNKASICRSKAGCQLGTFDSSKSSTFDDFGRGLFDISYQDNSSSKGDYFGDRFQIGSVSLDNLTIGLGRETSVPYGLIGVGYVNNEASIGTTRSTYPNLPVALQQAGLIKTIAYSLWLNDLRSSTGSILFGGIDTGKYVGQLTKVPVIRNDRVGNFTVFAVSMYSLEATSSSGSDTLTSSTSPISVVLDSGTSFSYLPQDMVSQAWQEVGAVWNSNAGTPVLPCSCANHAGHFSFVFSGPNGPRINVTMNELVLPLTSGPPPKFTSGPYRGKTMCGFGLVNQTEPPFILGDTFLRSAYVVYDLVNNEIGLAATNFNSTKTNVVAFASGGATIPSATAVSNQGNATRPPQASQTGLSASKGLQADSAAVLQSHLSVPGLVVMVVAMVYMLIVS
ncbi:Elongation factor G, mitochondrial [Tolypocladium capitatum]|uniref:Probable aspartic-type endopeptidase OPSB n=1 Tax=Tolypocladium capitatum TaxID=45235 RepID=A0A2K3QBG7_9HYPO|nr:Elongation factor G, mitochondrial [Tolypocladium capitatum]